MFDNIFGKGGHHVKDVVVELLWEAMFSRRVQSPRSGQVFNHGLQYNRKVPYLSQFITSYYEFPAILSLLNNAKNGNTGVKSIRIAPRKNE